jgi:hypothetical protein
VSIMIRGDRAFLWQSRPRILAACAIVQVGLCQTETVVTSHGVQDGAGVAIDSEVRTASLSVTQLQ